MSTNTTALIEFLDQHEIGYSIDNNPAPEKVSRIQAAIARKKNLMKLAVDTYQQIVSK